MFKSSKVLLIATGLCLSHGALAAGKFSLGVEDLSYLPYYTTVDGKYTGFGQELFNDYAKASSTEVTFVPLPIKRLLKSFLEGDVQAKFPDSAYWAGDQKEGYDIIYSDPVVNYIDGIMIKPDRKGMTKSSLKNMATVRGFTPYVYLDDIKADRIKVLENSGFEATLKQVAAGRADGAYVNVAVAQYTLTNELKKPDALIFAPELPHSAGFYYLSTVNNTEIIDSVNKFLNDDKAEVDALKAKYDLILDY